MNSIRCP